MRRPGARTTTTTAVLAVGVEIDTARPLTSQTVREPLAASSAASVTARTVATTGSSTRPTRRRVRHQVHTGRSVVGPGPIFDGAGGLPGAAAAVARATGTAGAGAGAAAAVFFIGLEVHTAIAERRAEDTAGAGAAASDAAHSGGALDPTEPAVQAIRGEIGADRRVAPRPTAGVLTGRARACAIDARHAIGAVAITSPAVARVDVRVGAAGDGSREILGHAESEARIALALAVDARASRLAHSTTHPTARRVRREVHAAPIEAQPVAPAARELAHTGSLDARAAITTGRATLGVVLVDESVAVVIRPVADLGPRRAHRCARVVAVRTAADQRCLPVAVAVENGVDAAPHGDVALGDRARVRRRAVPDARAWATEPTPTRGLAVLTFGALSVIGDVVATHSCARVDRACDTVVASTAGIGHRRGRVDIAVRIDPLRRGIGIGHAAVVLIAPYIESECVHRAGRVTRVGGPRTGTEHHDGKQRAHTPTHPSQHGSVLYRCALRRTRVTAWRGAPWP